MPREARHHYAREQPDLQEGVLLGFFACSPCVFSERAMRSVLPFFARRGITSPFGKLADLGRLRVPTETGELVRAAAARAGLPIAEYVRKYVELGHHGRQEIEHRITLQLDAIEVAVPKRDTKGTPE